MPDDKIKCFVIMPFGEKTPEHTEEYWTRHFEDFLKPLIEENPNFEAHRSKPMREGLLGEIIKNLLVSPVVVADLTDSNPNVFWELGVRQSFKHGTITIAEKGYEIPFDISDKGTLFYTDDHIEDLKFCTNFKLAVQDCLDYPESPDSRVLETISGRGTLFEIFRRDEAIRRLDAVISECDWNLYVEAEVKRCVEYNRTLPAEEDHKFLATRFRRSSIELLVTTRYLDEDKNFYGLAEAYLAVCFTMNDMLNQWSSKPTKVENWLSSNFEEGVSLPKKFEEKSKVILDKLRKQF